MIEVSFEVTGKTLTELDEAAAKELLEFVDMDRKIEYDLRAYAAVSTHGESPAVVLWKANVTAQVDEAVRTHT